MAQKHEKEVEEKERMMEVIHERRWMPPNRGWLKCNIGVDVDKANQRSGGSWVLRNEWGTVIMHSRRAFSNVVSLDEAKFQGLLWTIECLRAHHVSRVIIAIDDAIFPNVILRPKAWPSFTCQYVGIIGRLRELERWRVIREDISTNRGVFFIAQSVTKGSYSHFYVAADYTYTSCIIEGRLVGGVDENGIAYYSNLINKLKANGIEPYVTLFHWDVPLTLEDEYGGFLSPRIVDDYKTYAELMFQRFGDRVKFWMTLNQPYFFATKGYGDGSNAPGRCTGCEFGGDSGTEPYVVAHHQLLAHAEAVSLYRKKYQKFQGGKIGTTLIGTWFTPLNQTSSLDKAAAERAFDFTVGWFLDPLVYGDYPKTMKEIIGDRLPRFTPQESELVEGSLDFLGLDYYFTKYATYTTTPQENPNVLTDPGAASFVYYPPGFRITLNYIKEAYKNPLTYITEHGVSDYGNLPIENALADNGRIHCHCSHLSCLKCAIEDGYNVAGYFAWSLMDNYEFVEGYTLRFGMNWVNFTNPADRKEKDSGKWFSKFIAREIDHVNLHVSSFII
ncbi:hypothetical protein F2Q68_00015985 [Brassica cretica]|uniref:thioglucosidase n=1 Tax=Brassica cretica TaxID=69181 RepID=A0A8S9HCY1_BRACR|nr:hypothetical protein F2Q68_00015985 [Brassica cretica]